MAFGEPGGPLVPCWPSPGRHVIYSAAPGSVPNRSDALAHRAKHRYFTNLTPQMG